MARLARLVVPGLPHHVTQRGNRPERVFFNDLILAHQVAVIVPKGAAIVSHGLH